MPVSEELTLAVALSPDAGGRAVGALLALPARRRPTALLVANHEASYGALPALREHSVTIPGDLSVICYEDSQLALWWHPAITVIDNNARQMGELAARLLLQRLDPADEPGRWRAEEFSQFRVGTRLIERGLVSGAAAAGAVRSVDAEAASSSVSPSSSQRSRAIGTLPLTQIWSCSALQVQVGSAHPHRVGDQADQLGLADLVGERLAWRLGEERGLLPGRGRRPSGRGTPARRRRRRSTARRSPARRRPSPAGRAAA